MVPFDKVKNKHLIEKYHKHIHNNWCSIYIWIDRQKSVVPIDQVMIKYLIDKYNKHISQAYTKWNCKCSIYTWTERHTQTTPIDQVKIKYLIDKYHKHISIYQYYESMIKNMTRFCKTIFLNDIINLFLATVSINGFKTYNTWWI